MQSGAWYIRGGRLYSSPEQTHATTVSFSCLGILIGMEGAPSAGAAWAMTTRTANRQQTVTVGSNCYDKSVGLATPGGLWTTQLIVLLAQIS